MLDNDEEEDDRILDIAADYGDFFEDTTMDEANKDAEGHVAEDDLGQMLRKAEEVCEIEKKSRDISICWRTTKYCCT